MSVPRTIDAPRLPAGATLGGRYRVDAPLGAGGMARVYAARDLLLERRVALKVSAADLGADPEAAARFAAEARTAAGLSHPGLVAVFDAGVDGGVPYLVMEYVEGRTLARVLREDRITPERAVAIAAAIADALAAIHARGFVHRDVKPGNVLVADDTSIKVADFGIAGEMRSSAARGTVHGTPGYAAPEQIRGEPLDGRADLFALGVVLFEMLTGRLPFEAPSDAVGREPPAPSHVDPASPPALDAIVLTALAEHPEDRFANAGAFRDALLDQHGAPTAPLVPNASPRAGAHRAAGRRRGARALTTAAVLILVLAGTWVAAGTPFLDRPRDGLPAPSPSPSAGSTAPAAIAPTSEPPAVAEVGGSTPPANDDRGEDGDRGRARRDEPCDNRGPGNCEDREQDDGGGHSG